MEKINCKRIPLILLYIEESTIKQYIENHGRKNSCTTLTHIDKTSYNRRLPEEEKWVEEKSTIGPLCIGLTQK